MNNRRLTKYEQKHRTTDGRWLTEARETKTTATQSRDAGSLYIRVRRPRRRPALYICHRVWVKDANDAQVKSGRASDFLPRAQRSARKAGVNRAGQSFRVQEHNARQISRILEGRDEKRACTESGVPRPESPRATSSRTVARR